MSMQQEEIERKIRQLDNDVQSIYDMLARISGTQTRQGNRLEELATGQERMAAAMEAGFTRLEEGLARGLATMNARITARLDRVLQDGQETEGTEED